MAYKRARSRSTNGRARKMARRRGPITKRRTRYTRFASKVARRVNSLYRMIETKESQRKSQTNVGLPHNNVHVVSDLTGTDLNIFRMAGQGSADPMEGNNGNRIGDRVTVKGIMIKGFLENALSRPKVHYRVMLVRGAKGETFNRTNLFKGDSDNKMLDQMNTERFTIVAQKTFTISASNVAASTIPVAANGQPSIGTAGGVGTKIFKMWIPGYKFGRGGNVQYENGSATQVKFFEYKLVIVAYDWYGTPQDTNNVGIINEIYTKMYFKDA